MYDLAKRGNDIGNKCVVVNKGGIDGFVVDDGGNGMS